MKTSYRVWTIRAALVIVALVGFAASTRAATINFTSSSQLSLAGKLAAVNLYYSPHNQEPGAGVAMTGPIQGVTFDNLNVTPNNNLAFALAGGGSLTISLPHTGEDRAQFTSSTITGVGADELHAEEFANDISYFAANDTGNLNFAFGAGNANKAVQVQIVGGDETWGGTVQASVGGVIKGTWSGDFNANTAQLLTFAASTDGAGALRVDLAQVGGNFAGIAGVIVTAVPEPGSLLLAAIGVVSLVLVRRRSTR